MKVIYLNCDEGINKREIIAAVACINFDGLSFINYNLVLLYFLKMKESYY